MANSSAEAIVLKAAPSSELKSEFDRLMSATTIAGDLKYPPSACRKLATVITCRSYGPHVLQLSHLIVAMRRIAAQTEGGDFLALMMELSDLRVGGYSSLLRGRVSEVARGVALGPHYLEVEYGSSSFRVQFGRMPMLFALLEFCINRLGLDPLIAIAEADDPTNESLISSEGVSKLANALSALLYDAVKADLPSVQAQRKYRHLIQFIERSDNCFSADTFDDSNVLEFWITVAGTESAFGTDFKQFSTVFRAFISLHKTLYLGRVLFAQERAYSIGEDWQAGEVNPAIHDGDLRSAHGESAFGLEATIDAIDEETNALELLTSPPHDRIKFLNNVERKLADLLFECGRSLSSFPVSYMRAECFKTVQRSIARAAPARARELIKLGSSHSYSDRVAALERLSIHMAKVGLATLHVVSMARRIAEPWDSETLPSLDSKRSEKAFRDLNRAGFDESAWKDGEKLSAFVSAVDLLARVTTRLDEFRSQLESVGDWNKHWRDDVGVFSLTFEQLYLNGAQASSECADVNADEDMVDCDGDGL